MQNWAFKWKEPRCWASKLNLKDQKLRVNWSKADTDSGRLSSDGFLWSLILVISKRWISINLLQICTDFYSPISFISISLSLSTLRLQSSIFLMTSGPRTRNCRMGVSWPHCCCSNILLSASTLPAMIGLFFLSTMSNSALAILTAFCNIHTTSSQYWTFYHITLQKLPLKLACSFYAYYYFLAHINTYNNQILKK